MSCSCGIRSATRVSSESLPLSTMSIAAYEPKAFVVEAFANSVWMFTESCPPTVFTP